MKKSIAIVSLLTFAAIFTFAEGQKEVPQKPVAPQAQGGPRQSGNALGDTTFEEVTLTGTLDLSGFAPRLVTADETYVLMVPRILPEGVEVTDGEEVTVTGYLHDTPRGYGRGYVTDNTVKVVAVTKAVIDGEEFDIPRGYGRMGSGWDNDDYPCWNDGPRGPGRRGGGRGSMMGGRGGYYDDDMPMRRW